MQLSALVSPRSISGNLTANSKKRLLERMGELLHVDHPELDEHEAFHSLFERERLGSTGIGHGVALPHGRMKGIKEAVGAFAILQSEMDYDSIDQQPVRMAFALLVPEEANEEHLQILAQLAKLFDQEGLRQRLLQAQNDTELYQTLTGQEPDSSAE